MLLLPGWQSSGPDHWQSRWESVHGCERVQQADWDWPRRGDWMARLDEVVQSDPRPTVLIAHSLGCQLVASWAAHSMHAARVDAALLVAPPDTERDDMPPNLFSWRPITREPMPFANLVVTSDDDPFCTSTRAEQMANDWGATCCPVGSLGHLNGDSGLGDWPQGWALLLTLLADRRESIAW
jgi:predicted alpha/beta hydrolase family esterase